MRAIAHAEAIPIIASDFVVGLSLDGIYPFLQVLSSTFQRPVCQSGNTGKIRQILNV